MWGDCSLHTEMRNVREEHDSDNSVLQLKCFNGRPLKVMKSDLKSSLSSLLGKEGFQLRMVSSDLDMEPLSLNSKNDPCQRKVTNLLPWVTFPQT